MSRTTSRYLALAALLMALALILLLKQNRAESIPSTPSSRTQKHQDGSIADERATKPVSVGFRAQTNRPLESGALAQIRALRNKSQVTKFEFFDNDQIVTSQLLAACELDENQAIQLQGHFSKFLMANSDLFQKRLQKDLLRSDAQQGINAYKCPPHEDEANSLFEAFSKQLETDLGASKAQKILLCFPVESLFGALGKNETLIKVMEDVDQKWGGERRFEFEMRDGQTGQLKASAESTERMFHRYFPGIFVKEPTPQSQE